jgi:1-pyrroline-5-carboxylate dehydrogenase
MLILLKIPMSNGNYIVPDPSNEPVLNYAPGSGEREDLKSAIHKAGSEVIEVPMIINGKEVISGKKIRMTPPHDIHRTLAYYFEGEKNQIGHAIESAIQTAKSWSEIPWEERASIFLKAAEILTGPYRAKMNAATMIGQSKNVYQSEIDAVCELADFFRFNVKYMEQIYGIQPNSVKGVWNRTDWRPLEGFVFALTPFNFTSISGNLPTAPAMLGNTVVWKPSKTQLYSARIIMEILKLAGLPDGVINMVTTPGPLTAGVVLKDIRFAGIHFTGSIDVFRDLWQTIANNLQPYRAYPHIVGETGGKDFMMVHSSANAAEVATALSRGAFEYQGQKCSAVSRAYIPDNLWDEIIERLEADIKSFKIGSPEDFGNFFNAVIDESSFNKLAAAIEKVGNDTDANIIIGGTYDKSIGYFIHPTVIETANPHYFSMEEELFGPILTIYKYPYKKYEETLSLCDETSLYGLTGAIFAHDRAAIELATRKLRFAAGNFYINDKPTGAVVGQQPFGGSRGSGTNDKSGSMINLLRWLSPRSIKENFNPPTDYRYPFLLPD